MWSGWKPHVFHYCFLFSSVLDGLKPLKAFWIWLSLECLKRRIKNISCSTQNLGGGFNHFLCSPRPLRFNDPIWFIHIIQMGWNSTTNSLQRKVQDPKGIPLGTAPMATSPKVWGQHQRIGARHRWSPANIDPTHGQGHICGVEIRLGSKKRPCGSEPRLFFLLICWIMIPSWGSVVSNISRGGV